MTVHAPVPDYVAARQAMVDSQLRPQGVNDPAVIEAMSLVPREQFVPDEQKTAGLYRPRGSARRGQGPFCAGCHRAASHGACAHPR